MTSKIAKLVFVTLALLFGAMIAPRSADAAAVDMFVKLDGVDGESTDDRHRGWIQAFSVQTGIATPQVNPGSGAGAAKPHFSDLHFAHHIDKASPTLAMHAAGGSRIKTVVLEFRRTNSREVFYKITLTDVVITSIAVNVTGDSVGEQVALAFSRIEWEAREQRPDGTTVPGTKGGWDVTRNAKL